MTIILTTLLEQTSNSSQEYYEGIYLDKYGNYIINRKGGEYLGYAKTIEEALQYRDLFRNTKRKNIPRPSELNLKTNNPYINGLKYPIPSRLKSLDGKHKKGLGSITKHSRGSYKITYNKIYYCSCRTYEQAYYVKQELIKADWDKKQLPRILKEYPKWYTWLMGYYRYITRHHGQYYITIPKNHSDSGKIQQLIYKNIEDALHERDFLVKHNWNYDLLVECIDDTNNPYYYTELPPYPERKIRNIAPRKNHDDDLRKMQKIIKDNPGLTQEQLASQMGMLAQTIRQWLKQYNTHFSEFITICLTCDDPLEKLEQEQLIYTPDLSIRPQKKFKGYVHYNPTRKSPYRINYNKTDYGSYPTRELADKIVKDLIRCDWDKKQLRTIQEKHGHHSTYGARKGIYKNRHRTGYYISKKINKKTVNFGSYHILEQALIARNLLEYHEWNKEKLPQIQAEAKWIHHIILNILPNTMFKKNNIEANIC